MESELIVEYVFKVFVFLRREVVEVLSYVTILNIHIEARNNAVYAI